MQITLDNRDLENVHIDTYGMLTGESYEEQEREYMRDELNREDWDTVDIKYNHDAIVKDLAMASIDYLTHELTTEKPKIVESITYESHGSPKYYNYTTDYYTAVYEVNPAELHKYIADNYDAILQKCLGYARVYTIADITIDDKDHAGLCHYIDATINGEYYNYALWEAEYEVYSNNATIAEPNKTNGND